MSKNPTRKSRAKPVQDVTDLLRMHPHLQQFAQTQPQTVQIVVMPLEDRLLKAREVMEMIGFQRTSLYAMIKSGEFPRQIRRNDRCVRWRLSEVQAWINNGMGYKA